MKGVTLTDLQEAEKTMKTDNKGREKKEEEEKEKEAKMKKGEEGVRAVFYSYRPAVAEHMSCGVTEGILCSQEVSWRSRIASLQKSDLLGLTQPAGTPRPQTSDKRGTGRQKRSSMLNVTPVEMCDLLLSDCCLTLSQMSRPAQGRVRQSDGPESAERGGKLGPGERHRGPGR